MCTEFDTEVALVDRDGVAVVGRVAVLHWTKTPGETIREVPLFGLISAVTQVEPPNLHLIKVPLSDGTDEHYLAIDLQRHSDAVEDNGTVHPDLHVFALARAIDVDTVVQVPAEL